MGCFGLDPVDRYQRQSQITNLLQKSVQGGLVHDLAG